MLLIDFSHFIGIIIFVYSSARYIRQSIVP